MKWKLREDEAKGREKREVEERGRKDGVRPLI